MTFTDKLKQAISVANSCLCVGLDPNLDRIPDLIFEHRLLRPGGWLVLEHNPYHDFKSHPHFQQERSYGKTLFSIFELAGAEEE